jgi:hypothetical protein
MTTAPSIDEMLQPYREALALDKGLPDSIALGWALRDPASALDALAHSVQVLTEGYSTTILRLAEEADRNSSEAAEAADMAKVIGDVLHDQVGDLTTWIKNCARFQREREIDDAPRRPEALNPYPEYDRFRGPRSEI